MAKKVPKQKQPRDLVELIQALEKQLRVLRRHRIEVLANRNTDYLSEVAIKLRVLVFEGKSSKSLLHFLLGTFEDPGWVPKLDFVAAANPFQHATELEPLSVALSRVSVSQRVGNEMVTIGPRELVEAFADQAGGAHEDHRFHIESALVVYSPIQEIWFGVPANVARLDRLANLTLIAGTNFVRQLTYDAMSIRRLNWWDAIIDERRSSLTALDVLMDKAGAAEHCRLYAIAAKRFLDAAPHPTRGQEAMYRRAVCLCLCGEGLEEVEQHLASAEPASPSREWMDPLLRGTLAYHRGRLGEAAETFGRVMPTLPEWTLHSFASTSVFCGLVSSLSLTEDQRASLGDAWCRHFVCPIERWLCPPWLQ